MKHILIILIILSLLLQSCLPKIIAPTIRDNTQSIYNPLLNRLNPEYIVSNTESGNSRLYTKIYLSGIMFIPTDTTNRNFAGKIKIKYTIYSPENLDIIVDSASTIYDIKKRKKQNNVITYININANLLNEYYLKITTTDMFRRVSIQNVIFVSNKNFTSLANSNY